MSARDRLHRLVDELSDAEVSELEQRLRASRELDEAFVRALRNSPEEDGPLTDDDRKALEEGLDSLARGERRPLDEIARERGL